jgi:hypothetical protein
MAHVTEPKGIAPEDPLNSYREASWRGVLLTAGAILVTIVLLWLAYSAALNSPELQRLMDGRQEIQGPLYPADHPAPGRQ